MNKQLSHSADKIQVRTNYDADRSRILSQIPIDQFFRRYSIVDRSLKRTIKQFPTLCYLLGKVTESEVGKFRLTEGSGMFALSNTSDALQWKKMFRHLVGTAVHAEHLATIVCNLDERQKKKMATYGEFDINSFMNINPLLMRDVMLMSHFERRKEAERDLSATDHNKTTQLPTSMPDYLATLRQVNNAKYLLSAFDRPVVSVIDALLCYADWTFDQNPMTRVARFTSLYTKRRDPKAWLDLFETTARKFEYALLRTRPNTTLTPQKRPLWEKQLLRAYCHSALLNPKEVYPLDFK